MPETGDPSDSCVDRAFNRTGLDNRKFHVGHTARADDRAIALDTGLEVRIEQTALVDLNRHRPGLPALQRRNVTCFVALTLRAAPPDQQFRFGHGLVALVEFSVGVVVFINFSGDRRRGRHFLAAGDIFALITKGTERGTGAEGDIVTFILRPLRIDAA